MMVENYIHNIYQEFKSILNPHKIGEYKLTSNNLNTYIADTCKYLELPKDRFVFKQDFSKFETITFEKCYCKDCSLILWTLPSIKYRITISSGLNYDCKTYSTIVNNAIILLNINEIYYNNCSDNLYLKLFCLACCFIINKHHITRTNGSFYTEIKINEFIINCLANFISRYENKEQFNIDLMETTTKNTEYVYKTKNRVTLGYADKNIRHSISHMKFSSEEIEYIKSLKDSGISVRKIRELYLEKYGKNISIGKISTI